MTIHNDNFPWRLDFKVYQQKFGDIEVMFVPEVVLPMQMAVPVGKMTEKEFKKQILQDVLNEVQHTLEHWND